MAILAATLAPGVGRESVCSVCERAGPPCEAVWKTPLVFVGTVASVEVTREPFLVRSRFAVREVFRGAPLRTIVIESGGSSCDSSFEEGVDYLVYAQFEGGRWTSSNCSRTRPLSAAAEDMAYLRLQDNKKEPHIRGTVSRRDVDLSDPRQGSVVIRPIAGVRVSLTDGGSTRHTVTGSDGAYSIGAPAGRPQTISFSAPGGLRIPGSFNVTIPNRRACVAVDGDAYYDGTVSGVIADGEGRPIPFLPVFLRLRPRTTLMVFDKDTMTDATGRFELRSVQPAQYVLLAGGGPPEEDAHYPPLVLDNPLVVGPGASVDAGHVVLQNPQRPVLLEGLVLDDAGRPADDVRVSVRLSGAHFDVADDILTDAGGRFRVSLLPGREHEISAFRFRDGPSGGVRLEGTTRIWPAESDKLTLRLTARR